jgi:hypothetical protein
MAHQPEILNDLGPLFSRCHWGDSLAPGIFRMPSHELPWKMKTAECEFIRSFLVIAGANTTNRMLHHQISYGCYALR